MYFRSLTCAMLVMLFASTGQAQNKGGQAENKSGQAQNKNQPTTIIYVTLNFSSPAEAKKVGSALALARNSAEAGRQTIVFFNSLAAKLGTSLLPSDVNLPGNMALTDQLSKLKGQGVEIYVSSEEAQQQGIKKKDLVEGVSMMSTKQLLERIDSDTVVFSY